ncbi:MAG: sel1 repeat family protein, partial [Synergistes sp.]|nr:sel1 repeat family protein [Synergistes sp.]
MKKIKGFGQDEEQTQEWLRKAAEQGNAAAQFALGALYSNGQGVEQSYEQAAEW